MRTLVLLSSGANDAVFGAMTLVGVALAIFVAVLVGGVFVRFETLVRVVS